MAFPWLKNDAKCHKRVAAAPQLKAPDILNSIPGLGEITALALLIDMPERGSQNADQWTPNTPPASPRSPGNPANGAAKPCIGKTISRIVF